MRCQIIPRLLYYGNGFLIASSLLGRLRMKYELPTPPDKQAITAMAAMAAITLTGDITVCYAPWFPFILLPSLSLYDSMYLSLAPMGEIWGGRRFLMGKCIKIRDRKTREMQIKWFELRHWDAEYVINWHSKSNYCLPSLLCTIREQKQQRPCVPL